MSAAEYRYLEHTADAKFEAFGDSREAAFANAALALTGLMWDPEAVSGSRSHPVAVSGNDLKQLLLGFLEEVLFLWESRGFMLHEVQGLRIVPLSRGFELKAVLRGENRQPGIEVQGDVKAVTYNDMQISRNRRWRIQVVVDM